MTTRMPIFTNYSRKLEEYANEQMYPRHISFELLDEQWAEYNHGQSLQRLAERGGMSPMEIMANLDKLPWYAVKEKYSDNFKAYDKLVERLKNVC